ncbi:hypothetical protein VNI00_006825 [Paramarasmius palmivorus]|uniref:Uncharacterized protein n=1 Tax=Paramarasmius palmivorus TaxID=297713 RepID=A0AAW0D937_9AGAR
MLSVSASQSHDGIMDISPQTGAQQPLSVNNKTSSWSGASKMLGMPVADSQQGTFSTQCVICHPDGSCSSC